MKCFTTSEMSLLELYDLTGKDTLLSDLRSAREDTYDSDEKQAFTALIGKLEGMADAEYDAFRPELLSAPDHISNGDMY